MKRTMNTMLTIGTALFLASSAGAQMMGSGPEMMGDQVRQAEGVSQNQSDRPYMDYRGIPNCYGMGPGMMGGYGMGHMNRHMMDEHGWRTGKTPFQNHEKYDQYLDATKDLRKKLHDMRFEYREMMRDPKTTVGDLENKQQEMFKLQQEIYEKFDK